MPWCVPGTAPRASAAGPPNPVLEPRAPPRGSSRGVVVAMFDAVSSKNRGSRAARDARRASAV